ncbi:MAG: helix-turn-helix domain-containing protein [Coriobacteriales bacterium]|jgi:DNA-binding XRE family transcriptional regulator|nr:helix-turn-helix domain-containing protein [Coriobacteriales bacterium]
MSYTDELLAKYGTQYSGFEHSYKEECEKLDIAVALTVLRKEEGLSQKQLAELAHKPQSTIARIENGTLNPSYRVSVTD